MKEQIAHRIGLAVSHPVAQATPEDRVVHFVLCQQFQHRLNQSQIARDGLMQAQLGAHAHLQRSGEGRFIGLQRGQRQFLFFNQRQQRLP